MASGHNSSGSSVFRGLHYNSGTSSGSNSTGLHFHNHLHHHLQQHHTSPPNYSANIVHGPSNSSTGTGNQIITAPSTAVSLPAPAPVPGKSSTSGKHSDSSKATSSRGVGTNPDQMQGLVAKLWFDHNLASSLSALEKDEHEKRIKDLRKQLEYIGDTSWKFMPIEKYIGQI